MIKLGSAALQVQSRFMKLRQRQINANQGKSRYEPKNGCGGEEAEARVAGNGPGRGGNLVIHARKNRANEGGPCETIGDF